MVLLYLLLRHLIRFTLLYTETSVNLISQYTFVTHYWFLRLCWQ
nr:MAG TPA_asm: hypothetical protein [Caudoviricetes sp.]